MQAWQLPRFGLDNLEQVSIEDPRPGPDEVLVRLEAASVNPRDNQIIAGQFSPDQALPLIPLSDGAGTVVETGARVRGLTVGDRVAPLFFPRWQDGEALSGERAVSGGLEAPGVLRALGVYHESAVVRVPAHLSAVEAACYACAGLTAWTALVETANVQPGNTVLVQGTGGVAMAALQLAKALGALVIVISSSDERLARARDLGADNTINYRETPEWGERAFELAGRGVDAVVEIGGTGTLAQSLTAIRHGGHIAIIGYMAGADMGITVFPLIIRNAHLHGIGTGNRRAFERLFAFVDKHGLHPVIAQTFAFGEAPSALRALETGGHLGKVCIDYSDLKTAP
jgi:NADPH:quinone reductase-like Zn-dependent oxidoreductase